MGLKIAVNASCLLKPMTGIGRYTHNLFSAIEKESACEIDFLYGLSWSKNLVDPVNQYQRTYRAINKKIPYVRTMARQVQKSILNYHFKKNKFSLYHEPNFLPLSFDIPVISTIHDLSIIKYPDYHPIDRVKIFEKHLLGTIEKSEYLISDSEFVKREIIETFGVHPDKIVTTLLGVEKNFYPRTHESAARMLDAYKLRHKSYFLVVSTLEPRKNFKLVIDAYIRLDNRIKDRYPLVIVGMRGWELDQFDKDIEKLKRLGYLRLLGYVADDELPILYSSAKLFLYPSVYEGFGLPPLEAMACGTPVVTSNTSSLPEVIGDAGLMVSPCDDIGLYEKILQLVEDGEFFAEFSQKSIDRAKLFTWKRCAEQTIDVYRRI